MLKRDNWKFTVISFKFKDVYWNYLTTKLPLLFSSWVVQKLLSPKNKSLDIYVIILFSSTLIKAPEECRS